MQRIRYLIIILYIMYVLIIQYCFQSALRFANLVSGYVNSLQNATSTSLLRTVLMTSLQLSVTSYSVDILLELLTVAAQPPFTLNVAYARDVMRLIANEIATSAVDLTTVDMQVVLFLHCSLIAVLLQSLCQFLPCISYIVHYLYR